MQFGCIKGSHAEALTPLIFLQLSLSNSVIIEYNFRMLLHNPRPWLLLAKALECFLWLGIAFNLFQAVFVNSPGEMNLLYAFINIYLVFFNQDITPRASSRKMHHTLTLLYAGALSSVFVVANTLTTLNPFMLLFFNVLALTLFWLLIRIRKSLYRTHYRVMKMADKSFDQLCFYTVLFSVIVQHALLAYLPHIGVWLIQALVVFMVLLWRYDMRFNMTHITVKLTADQHTDIWPHFMPSASSTNMLRIITSYESIHGTAEGMHQYIPVETLLLLFSSPFHSIASESLLNSVKAHVDERLKWSIALWDFYHGDDCLAASHIQDMLLNTLDANALALPDLSNEHNLS